MSAITAPLGAPTLTGLQEAQRTLATRPAEDRWVLLLAAHEDLSAAKAAGLPAVALDSAYRYGLTRPQVQDLKSLGIEIRISYPHTREGYRWALEAATKLSAADADPVVLVWPAVRDSGFSISALWAELHQDPTALEDEIGRLQELSATQIPMRPPGGFFHPKLKDNRPFLYPYNYSMGKHGVYSVEADKDGRHLQEIATRPLWIDELMEDLDSHEYAVRLCTTEAHPMRVPRGVIMDTQRLKALADNNFPVRSTGTGAVIKFLEDAEAANRKGLPNLRTVSKMGWRSGGFSWGRTIIRGEEDQQVSPSPAAGIEDSWFERHRAAGTPEGWASVLPKLSEFHVPIILILASLASPLLSKLGVQSAVFETVGEAGAGKTSAQTIAQSVWGYGHESELASWSSTPTALEVVLATHNHLPLILNENKSYDWGPRGAELQARVGYMIGEGRGKARSNKQLGVNAIRSWTLNVLASGEHSITAGTNDTGILARVFPLWTSPFKEKSASMALRVKPMVEIVNEHYGHAGPMMIRHLLELDEAGWEAIRKHYKQAQKKLAEAARGTPKQSSSVRMAQNWGVLWVAATMLEKMFPGVTEAGTYHRALLKGWRELMTRGEDRSYSERALDVVRGFLATMSESIKTDKNDPKQSIGRFSRTRGGTEFVAFVKEPLAKALDESGLNIETALEHWKNNGFLLTKDGPYWPTLINKSTARCVAIKKEILDLEEAEDSNDEMPHTLDTLVDCPF
jgi:uncharacterized protein (DUF927 family)